MLQTKINLPRLSLTKSISSIRLAKYGKWFDDCSNDVKVCCSLALLKLQDHYNWKIIDVTITDIEMMRLAHHITIGSECSTALDSYITIVSPCEICSSLKIAGYTLNIICTSKYPVKLFL
ncbi:unnamed protein product [Lathyrus sativus]|nr:unnamed protein product [Lathyrus sativus]